MSRVSHALLRAFTFIPNRIKGAVKQTDKEKEKREAALPAVIFDWKAAVADATIIAGMNFFATLSSMSIVQIRTSREDAFLTAFISAGLGFFTTLAIKRGLSK